MTEQTDYHSYEMPEPFEIEERNVWGYILNTLLDNIDDDIIRRGVYTDRPPAEKKGRLYLATDNSQFYYDTGGDNPSWERLGANIQVKDSGSTVFEGPNVIDFDFGVLATNPSSGTVEINLDQSKVYVKGSDFQFEGDLVAPDGEVIWDESNTYIPQEHLENDTVTINASNGLINGGAVSLGGSIDLDVDPSTIAGDGIKEDASLNFAVEPADFAGSFLTDDGADNLQVDIGRGLEDDGTGNIQVNEDLDFTFTSAVDFSAGFDTQGDITDGAQTIWDATNVEIPDSALGSIDNSTLTNSTVGINSGDGLKNGSTISLGGSVTLNVEPQDFAGSFLSDDGTDDLQVDIGRGLEDDGSGNIRVDEDTNYTFTSGIQFSSGLDTRSDIVDDTTVIWDSSVGEIPDAAMGSIDNSTLTNSTVGINSGDGLKNGSTISLGGSVTLDVEPADFAGSFLTDDGADNLQVDIGRGLEDDGSGNIRVDEDTNYTFTSGIQFSSGLDTRSDIVDDATVIWDSSAGEVPDAALGSIDNGTLTNDSITLNGGSGLKNGSTATLGGSFSLDIEPADFAGTFLSDDGADNLEVDIGTGVEDDGSGNIRLDEGYSPTWTSSHTFNGGIVTGGSIDLQNSYQVINAPEPTSDTDLARKQYVDTTAQGLTLKDSARASPTANIDLTATTDPNPVDGVTLADGDRVLLKEQTTLSENGIYVANTATDPSTWTRALDFDDDADVTSGTFAFVEEGTSNGSTSWIVSTPDPITVGTTDIEWSQFASAGEITAGDGLTKSGLTLNIEPADFAGTFLSDDGSDNLQVDVGRGLENDGSGNVRVDEDTDYTFTTALDFNAGLNTSDDITDGSDVIWDSSVGEIPDAAMGSIDNSTLTNSTVGINSGDGLKNGSTISLGGSVTLDVEPADFAGSFLTDDGADNLQVDIGRGLEDDGSGNIQFDEDTDYTFTTALDFNAGLNTSADITDGASVIWDSSASEIPDSAMGSIDNSTLTNSSVTVTSGDGLKNGGSVSLGGSTTLDIEPADFAGSYLTDDGADNLQVDIGNGLTGDGSGNISVDEAYAFAFSNAITFDSGLDTQGDITDGTQTIWDEVNQEIPDSALGSIDNATLTNSSVTVTSGDGLKNGGSVSLGGSTTLDIEPADFAGSYLSDDGSDNLQVNLGAGVTGDGSGNVSVDEAYDFTFTSAIDFSAGLDTQGDITDGTQTIWDVSAQEIPDSAMGSIDNSTLTNSSVTVNSGNQLTGGGSVALGGSITLDVDDGDGSGLDADTVDGFEASDLKVTKSLAQLTSTDTTTDINKTSWTDIPWDSQLILDGGYTHDATNTPAQITFDNAGTYYVEVTLSYDVTGSDVNPGVKFNLAGTRLDTFGLTGYTSNANNHTQASNTVHRIVEAAAGDTLIVQSLAMGNETPSATMRASESNLTINQLSGTTALSGDADTLDGLHANDFVKADGSVPMTGTLGVNLGAGSDFTKFKNTGNNDELRVSVGTDDTFDIDVYDDSAATVRDGVDIDPATGNVTVGNLFTASSGVDAGASSITNFTDLTSSNTSFDWDETNTNLTIGGDVETDGPVTKSVNLPTQRLDNGEYTSLTRIPVPSGSTLRLKQVSVVNDSFNAPSGLEVLIRNTTAGTTEASYNTTFQEGSPITDLAVGGDNIIIAVDNGNWNAGTGSTEYVNATVEYDIV